jgi:hypothetical protein
MSVASAANHSFCSSVTNGCSQERKGIRGMRRIVLVLALSALMTAAMVGVAAAAPPENAMVARVAALETAVKALQADLTTTKADLAATNARLADTNGKLSDLTTRVVAIEGSNVLALDPFVSVVPSAINDLPGPHVLFTGVNVHVRNGNRWKESHTSNGTGNLILGYDEVPESYAPAYDPATYRTGSHNLVLGRSNRFSSWGGLVSGVNNTLSGGAGAVVGGEMNVVSGWYGAIVGGLENSVSAPDGVIAAGRGNQAIDDPVVSTHGTAVFGGINNTAAHAGAAVLGGLGNTASTECATVAGGYYSVSKGGVSTVLGGYEAVASGYYATVAGGYKTVADQMYQWAAANMSVNVPY